MPGAKSVVTLLLNYYPEKYQNENAPKIAKYAYGLDYHYVIKDKLNALPQNVSIASFALTPGEGELIYLVPPLLIGEVLPQEKLEKQFLESFNKIDPLNNHKKQVQELMRNYL